MAQPHKGSRTLHNTRLPDDLSAKLCADAEANGVYVSTMIADILAEHYDYPKPSARWVTKKGRSRQTEVLPLDAAS